jgi:predicted HTH transcriptional regulator
MTNREFYTNIANGNVTEAEKEFALAAIAKMDETNEKRKNKVSPKEAEKQAEMAALRESIFAVITNDPQTEADIAAQVGVTGAKARAQLRKLVAEGKVVSADIKVPKKGTCKGYFIPATDVAENAEA